MAQIRVPMISPFSVTGPMHDADDRHIQSHHVAYEIASLSHFLNRLITEYDTLVEKVTAIQAQNATLQSKSFALKLKRAEKSLLASILPYQIKSLRTRLKVLNDDLRLMTQ